MAVNIRGVHIQRFRQRTGLLHTGIDLIGAERHQLCADLPGSLCQPDRQLYIGTVGFGRVLSAVPGIGDSCHVKDDVRVFKLDHLPDGSFVRCAQKAPWQGAELIFSLPLLTNAGTDEAARTGKQNLFHGTCSFLEKV